MSMTGLTMGEPTASWKLFEETRAFLRDHLDHTLPDSRVVELHTAKMTFRERQSRLRHMLLDEEISKEKYLRDFTGATEDYMKATLDILGERDFAAIYGQAGYNPGAIIDRDVFFSQE